MRPRLRRLALTAHIVCSVGWLGTVGAFLALAVVGLMTKDADIVRSAYPSMDLIGWFVIVPCSVAALASGLVQALGTEWGLVRHYWVATKFVLTLGATGLLLVHMSVVRHASEVASGTFGVGGFRNLQVRIVVDAALAIIVLLTTTVLSVYKPWGMTVYGRRAAKNGMEPRIAPETAPAVPWGTIALAVGGVLLLMVLLHLTGLAGHY